MKLEAKLQKLIITPGSTIHETPVIRSFSTIDTTSLAGSRISNYHRDNNSNTNYNNRNNDISDDENFPEY